MPEPSRIGRDLRDLASGKITLKRDAPTALYFDGTSDRRFRIIVLMAERPALCLQRTDDQSDQSAHLRDRGYYANFLTL